MTIKIVILYFNLIFLISAQVNYTSYDAPLDPAALLDDKLTLGNFVDLGQRSFSAQINNVLFPYEPISDRDMSSSEAYIKFLISMRDYLKVGWSSVPPLDPYKRTNIEIPLKSLPLTSGLLTLHTLTVHGGTEYDISNILIRRDYLDGNFRLDVNFTIPRLVIESRFEVYLNIPLFGRYSTQGDAVVVLNQYEFNAALGGQSDNFWGKFLTEFKAIDKFAKTENLQVSLNAEENFITKILRWLHIDVLVAYLALRKDITQSFGEGILNQLNKIGDVSADTMSF